MSLWFQLLLCITDNSIKHQSFVYTQLNDQTVLFQTIQFIISIQFKCQPYQVLPLRVRVVQGVMAMKLYSGSPKAPSLLKPHHQIVLVSYPQHSLGEFYSTAEWQSVYSAVPVKWATTQMVHPSKGS